MIDDQRQSTPGRQRRLWQAIAMACVLAVIHRTFSRGGMGFVDWLEVAASAVALVALANGFLRD